PWSGLLWTVYALGWWTGTYQSPPFRDRWLYAWVRHPMMLGLLVAFWATPRMTVGHLFFAAAGTGYVAVGLHFEERDLYRQLGNTYRDYADRVPALVPSPTRRIRDGELISACHHTTADRPSGTRTPDLA